MTEEARNNTSNRQVAKKGTDLLQSPLGMAGSTFATIGVVDLVAHLGPTGILIGGLAGIIAYNFGDEAVEWVKESLSNKKKSDAGTPPQVEQAQLVGDPVEIDPDILAMVQSGDIESAYALAERARRASADEETGVPSFRKLLEDGTIAQLVKKRQILLGYVAGKPRVGSWVDLYSCGVGGLSGTGKSTTVRFLLYQMIVGGGHLVMIDPHIGDEEESLAAEFRAFPNVHLLPPCDDTEKEVVKRIKFLSAEFAYRKDRGIKGPAILFVLDEYNALVRRLSDPAMKALADLLLTLAQEGRKFGMFAMILAQRWSENDLGGKNYGAAIRSSLSSRIGHRFGDEDQAKKFMGTRNGPKLLELKIGYYLFRDTEGGLMETVTPATYQTDGDVIRSMMGISAVPSRVPSTPRIVETTGNAQEMAQEVDEEAITDEFGNEPETEKLTSPEDFKVTRVKELLRQKVSQSEIIETVWQAKSGRNYQKANEELREIIAQLIG